MKGMPQSVLQHIHLLKNTPLVSSNASCLFSMHPVWSLCCSSLLEEASYFAGNLSLFYPLPNPVPF